MGRRNRRVEKIMSDITDYFVDKIDRRIGEKVRKGLMVSDGLCKTKKFEKPKSDLKPKNLTVKEMQEKVKEHEQKAAIYAKAITGDQEDYFNEYQKLMKTRIEDHTDNVKTNKEKIMKDYEEAQLNLAKAEKKLSRFGDSKDGRKKIKNRQKTLKPKKMGDVDDYEKRADFLNEILNDDNDYQYEYEDRPENPPLEKVKNDDYDYNYEYESRGDFIDHPENASPKKEDEDDYKYEYEDREEHPCEKNKSEEEDNSKDEKNEAGDDKKDELEKNDDYDYEYEDREDYVCGKDKSENVELKKELKKEEKKEKKEDDEKYYYSEEETSDSETDTEEDKYSDEYSGSEDESGGSYDYNYEYEKE